MDLHAERSKLINTYKTELRALEKALSKGRVPGSKKEELRKQIDKLTSNHQAELDLFDETHGIAVKKQTDVQQTTVEQKPQHELKLNFGVAKLREICVKYGLSDKGNREALLTRLYSNASIINLDECNELNTKADAGVATTAATAVAVEPIQTGKKVDLYKENRKKLYKNNRIKQNRFGPSEETLQHADLEQQKKFELRRNVVAGLLPKLLLLHPEGIELHNIPDAFKEIKVKNFSHEELGFQSLDAWADSLALNEIHYSRQNKLLKHVTNAFSSDDENDEDNYASSGDLSEELDDEDLLN